MSTLFISLGEPVLAWLADYYFAATLLLLAALIGRQFVRQPAHRILIAWTAMLELVVLAVVCALPFWPKISFVAAPPPKTVAVIETPAAIVETPVAPMPYMPLPSMAGRSIGEPAPVEPIEPEAAVTPALPPTPQPRMTWSEWAVAAYLAGVAMVGLWLCWGAAAASWLCRRAKPAAEALKAELSDVVRNRRREPRLLVSEEIANAVALGVIRPTIVLPDAMVQASPPRTLRAVLLHEWAHIRHRDLWLLALGRFLLAVLFTHPLFWLLRRAIRGDQELLADAVAAGDNPHDYAEDLVRLVRMTGDNGPRSLSAAVGIWEGPSSFSRRIAMLLDESFRVYTAGSRRWRFKALVAMTLLGLVCSLATLQPARSTAKPKEDGKAAESSGSATEKSPWNATLSNGTMIELIGLASSPSDGQAWWRPDGSPLSERPYINKHDSFVGKLNDRRAVEVAYRVVGPGPEPQTHSCSIPDNLGMGSFICRDGEGQCLNNGVTATSVLFPSKQKTMRIRLGAVAGPWEVAAKMGPDGGKCERTDLPLAEEFKAMKRKGEFVVEGVMDQTWGLDQAYRLVVVGDDGAEHTFDVQSTRDVPKRRVRHCIFGDRRAKNPNYPRLTAIKEIRLEYRRFQFVEFKNVSLWPGEKTHVQTAVNMGGKDNDSGKSPRPSSQQTVRVVGTCVDANNRPIAGAEVCLYERKHAATFVLLEQRKTDAAGKFEFSDLHLTVPESDDDLRGFDIQAKAKGKAREGDGFTSAMVSEGVWRRKLILHDAMTISGRVTDTSGKPVAGALISNKYGPLGGSTDPNCLATTDANGFYRVTDAPKIGLKSREGALYVRHPDFLKNAVAYRENRDKIDFVLTPASIIEGKVIDAVTGKPAANVFVCASMIFPDGHEPRDRGLANRYADATITDAEGRYRLSAMAGKHYLRALQTQRGRTARPIEAFEIKEGERRTAPDLRLIEGGLIEASVVDAETGQPPKYRHGGEVVLYGPSCPLGMRTHTFEYRPDGVIRIRAVPGMNYVAFEDRARVGEQVERVEAVKDSSFDSKGRIPVEVVEGQTAKVQFKVRRIAEKKTEKKKAAPGKAPVVATSRQTARIAGTCVDTNKRPIADAEVSLYEFNGGSSLSLLETKRTDAAGKFAFADLHLAVPSSDEEVQHFVVIASAKGKARAHWELSLRDNHDRIEHYELELGEPMTITGRVTDLKGKPIAGAKISGFPRWCSNDPDCYAVTDADGFYKAEGVDKEHWNQGVSLNAVHPDFIIVAPQQEKPDKLNFLMEPASIIEGQVVDAVTGNMPAKAIVYACGVEPCKCSRMTVTDSNGRYRLAVRAGQYNIWAEHMNRTAIAVEGLALKNAEKRTVPDLRLIEGGVLEWQVLDVDTGRPIEQAKDNDCIGIRVYGPSRPISTTLSEFSSTADTQRQLRLAPGTNYVEFYYASGSVKDVPGCWEVVTDASFDRNGRKPVEIVEGQTAKVELKVRWNETKVPKNKNILTLASGGTYTSKTKAKKADDSGRPAAVVEGKVVDAISGKPATRARVWAQRDNPHIPPQITTTDSEGRYRLLLRPGTHGLWADGKNRTARAIVGFEAKEGETRTAPDMRLIEGGLLEWHIVDVATNREITQVENHDNLGIEVNGPSRPLGVAMPASSSIETGHSSIRLAPGTNYVGFFFASGSQKDVPGCWEVVSDSSFDKNGKKPIEIVEGQTATVELEVRWNPTKVANDKNVMTGVVYGKTRPAKAEAKKADDSGLPPVPPKPTKEVPAVKPVETPRNATPNISPDTTDSSEGFATAAQIVVQLSDPDWMKTYEMAGKGVAIVERMSIPEFRKRLGMTAEQERKLQPILKEFEQETNAAIKIVDKAMAVLTPEQRVRLRKEAMGSEGPVDSCSMSFVVKGESKQTKIPLPHPYPDLSDAAVQKSLGFKPDQAKQVRAILGNSPTLRDLLMREATQFTPAEREAQAAHYCFYTRNKSIGPNSLTSPEKRKKLWEKQAADRRAWRADRERQPLVKRCLELSKQFEAVLTPDQTAKYQELAYKAMEFAALNDPFTWAKIDASNEQNAAVLQVITESMTTDVKFASESGEKILTILDSRQKETLLKDIQRENDELERSVAKEKPASPPQIGATKAGSSERPPVSPKPAKDASAPAQSPPKPVARFQDLPADAKEYLRDLYRSNEIFTTLSDQSWRQFYGLSEEQEARFHTIDKEIADWTQDMLKTKDKAMAVLTPQQRLQLPTEALGPEGPRDATASGVVVKGEKDQMQLPSPYPYPDLSDPSVQKSLGFTAEQTKQVRAVLGDCEKANDLLAREALRLTPEDREKQSKYFTWCKDFTLLDEVAKAPDENKALDKIRSERQTWRARREKQPLVKRALELRKQFEAVLTPAQTTKYREMAFAEIADTALNDPLTLTKLGVNKDQQAAVQRIYAASQAQEFEFLHKTVEEMLKILDPQQRDQVLKEVKQDLEFSEEYSRKLEDKNNAVLPSESSTPKTSPTDKNGTDVNGVQLRIRSDKALWSVTEIPTLHTELRNSETGSPLQIQWGMSQLQLEVDGKWYKGSFFLGAPFTVCEPGKVLKTLVTVSPVWIEAKKEELRWNGSDIRGRSSSDPIRVIELRPGTHVVRVGCVVENKNEYSGFRVVSNAVKLVIEPPTGSQSANWPVSPELAKSIVVDLTDACLTHLNPTDKIIDDMLAVAVRVKEQSVGTPLQGPSQTLIGALTDYRKAIREKDGQAAEKERWEAITKAIIAMTRVTAGLPQDSLPSKPPAKRATNKSKAATISGRVVDYAGKGIAGADVGLQVYQLSGNALADAPLIAFAKADAEGHFRLVVPGVLDDPNQFATVWAIADGYQPARPNIHRILKNLIRNGENVRLSPAAGTVFEIVRHVNGKKEPVSGVRVTVLSQQLEKEVSFTIPPNWRDRVSGVSDAEGRVRLPNVIAEAITEASLQPAGQSACIRLDSRFFFDHQAAKSSPHFICALPQTGTIDGRLDAQGGNLPTELKITVQTQDFHRAGVFGEATVDVDAQGRFKVENIAIGHVAIHPCLSDRQPLREQIPADMTVLPDKTTAITIPVRRGVHVRGQIRTDDTKQGCSQLAVRLTCGQPATNHRGMTQVYDVKTDDQGRFSAIVPPGPVKLSPEHRLPYMNVESWRNPDGRWTIMVPAGKETFDLEPIEVVRTVALSGRLVNLDNEPLGNNEWYVIGYPDIPGKDFHKIDNSFPGVHPDKEGGFSGWYPRTYPAVHWTVVHVHWPTPYKWANDKFDAKVISRDPLVLQAPVHGDGHKDKEGASAKSGGAAKKPKTGLTVKLKVTDAESKEPIKSFTVAWSGRESDRGTHSWQRPEQFSNGVGEFRQENPWPKTTLRIEAEGHLPFITRSIQDNEGEVEIDVVMKPDAGIAGIILLPDGTPAAGAFVTLCTGSQNIVVEGGKLTARSGDLGRKLAKTAADGSFHLPAEVDPWMIVVAHNDGYAETTAAEFAKNSSKVQLKPWGRVEGEFVIDGKPIAACSINLGAGRGDISLEYHDSVTTDAAGKFTVKRVPPVKLFIAPFFKHGNFSYSVLAFSGRVLIASGETTRITLPRPGRPLIGRVALPPESKLRLADLTLEAKIYLKGPSISSDKDDFGAYHEFMKAYGKSFRRDKIAVNADGTFRVEGLPESQYVIQVSATGKGLKAGASCARRVTIPPLCDSKEPVDVDNLVLVPQ